MKVLYPASHDVPKLSDVQLSIKIARHSPCSICSCAGLHPAPDVNLVSDEKDTDSSLGDLSQYGSDDETSYLDTCDCGHTTREHGADPSNFGSDEFARRGRVAVRLDEQLQDVGKLLDFKYTDDDISNLRQQMKLPVALVSPTLRPRPLPSPDRSSSSINLPSSPASSDLSDPPPPSKKRRISGSSSLSEADDDASGSDDEEDEPLAARMVAKPSIDTGARVPAGKRSGKKMSSMKSKAQTAPVSGTGQEQAEKNGIGMGKTNGINGYGHGHEMRIKVEDKMDEGQLTRLATGVTVDAGGAPSGVPGVRTEKAASIELRKGLIKVIAVENDGHPCSLVILTGLKTLFQRQLPKMPREYIARLVFDANSKGLAIIKRGYKVVGGICFRPFPHRSFAEIVFFATASVDQVKGYGGMLMDHFKAHIRQTYPTMLHFLTYADNYAVGYFRKQGFSKDITLDRAVWAGYIKDYEGGTIMQCTMVKNFDYLDKARILEVQREAILSKIREMSKSHVVYDGLPQFQDGSAENVEVDPKDVPGLRESGWEPTMATNLIRVAPKNTEHAFMERLLSDLQQHPLAWAFLQPVNGEEVTDYYDVIKKPMDFSTMEHKLETNQYTSLDLFANDAQLVFNNCRLYNPEGTIYHKNATKLDKFVKDQLAEFARRGV